MKIRLSEKMKLWNLIRWILAVLMLLALPLAVFSPARAETHPLALDMTVKGDPWQPDGWIGDWEYQDDSIHAVLYESSYQPRPSKERVKIRCVVVDIKDPSQLRTTMSNESYTDPAQARSMTMAKYVNAIAAMNGDFVKYSYDFGYVVRQGVFYRDALDTQKYPRDVLVIDDAGDFSVVPAATSASMAAFLAEMEGAGRKPVNTFTFGPALIIGGEMQDVSGSAEFEPNLCNQRICLCQLDTLKYAIVQADGDSPKSLGFSLPKLAEYVHSWLGELGYSVKVAYNLDGGASTHLIMHNRLVNKNNASRGISDLIYFASAAGE